MQAALRSVCLLIALPALAAAQSDPKPRPMPRGVVVQASIERFPVSGTTIAEMTQSLRGALDDVWDPAEFSALAERLGAVSVEIPGAGHSAAVEEPLAMAEALDAFWHGRR